MNAYFLYLKKFAWSCGWTGTQAYKHTVLGKPIYLLSAYLYGNQTVFSWAIIKHTSCIKVSFGWVQGELELEQANPGLPWTYQPKTYLFIQTVKDITLLSRQT